MSRLDENNIVEHVCHKESLLAIIVRAEYRQQGIAFFTPDNFSQQLAYMNRPAGYVIEPHTHNEVRREVFRTQEVLLIRRGCMRVDFYGDNQVYIQSTVLKTGDVILLASQGHGFEMLEPTEIIEVKQGPYSGEQDKTRFKGIRPEQAVIHKPSETE